MNIEVIQDFIPQGNKNRPNRVNDLKYITIHNTGNTAKGANAEAHAEYIKYARTSWHYTVDDKEIYQHLPDKETAYHTATDIGNASSIGIEICMNEDGDILKATNNAIKLVQYLMKLYNIPLCNVVQHNSWNGKDCPELIRKGIPYSWNTFKDKLEVKEMDYETAMQVLMQNDVIDNREYWDNAVKCVKYLDLLIIKMANALGGDNNAE